MKSRIHISLLAGVLALAVQTGAWASEEASGHAESGGLFSSLGIDPKLILLQLFAFILLLLLLRRFLWGPMLRLFEQRQQDVDVMVGDARSKQATATELLEQYKAQLAVADEESRKVIQTAMEQGAQQKNEILEEARKSAEQIIANGQEQVRREREVALSQLRDLVATLATGAAGRIVQAQMDPAAQRALVDDFIARTGNPQ